MYYLQSRYYDPELGRFINADAYISTGQGLIGNNMFAYCNNNPVKYSDSSGQLPIRNTVFINDSGRGLIDLTDKLTAFMQENAEKLTNFVAENNTLEGWWYFYENVNDGGDLDIKLQDEWAFREGVKYTFQGRELRADDPGNINFGYVGAVLFPEEMLCMGAGLNQISNWGFQFGDLSTWFDDPRDNEMIKYGYLLYWEDTR